MRKSDRNETIDIMKGIGILTVVLGHCASFWDPIFIAIFSFHMPLFFIISGYCYKPYLIDKLVQRRFNSLIKPFIQFFLLGLIVSICVPKWRDTLTIKGIIYDIYLGSPDNIHNSSIWFLLCLFFVSILYELIESKYAGRFEIKIISSGLLGFFIVKAMPYLSFLPMGRLPWNFDCMMLGLTFYYIGAYIKEKEIVNKIKKGKINFSMVTVIVTIVQLLVIKFNGYTNMHGLLVNNPFLYYIGGVNGTTMIACYAVLIRKHIPFVKKSMLFFGYNSLFVLGTQSIIIRLFILAYNQIFNADLILYRVPFPQAAVLFVAVIITEVIMIQSKQFLSKENI